MIPRTVRPKIPDVAKSTLHQLHQIFKFDNPFVTKSNLSDVVLIAIDFENTQAIKGAHTAEANCQAGVAILDTKKIKRRRLDKVLETHMFVTGTPDYAARASRRYYFGKTKSISLSMVENCIRSLIPLDRKIVFVGHGVMNDLHVLQALGFQFPDNCVAVIDTLQAANEVFGCWAGSLSNLLKKLGCPHSRLHCAGNDANFTLKALLLLAAKELEKHNGDKSMINILRRHGRRKLPRRLFSQMKTKPKLNRRRSRTNAYTRPPTSADTIPPSSSSRTKIGMGGKTEGRMISRLGEKPELTVMAVLISSCFIWYCLGDEL